MFCRLSSMLMAVAISVCSTSAGAQELRNMPNLNQAVRSGWLQFRVITGRVTLDSSRVGNIQSANNFGQQQDQISIQTDNGDTTFLYNWSNRKQQLSIEVSNVSKVHINYAGKDDPSTTPVDFSQPLQGKTLLKVGPEGSQQVYRAPNLWHLFLAYPAETRQYLAPLLELLHPNWKLSETAAALEVELLRKVGSNEASDLKHWAALVEQLGEENFPSRKPVDRAIRAPNPAVLSYLQQLDFSRLD